MHSTTTATPATARRTRTRAPRLGRTPSFALVAAMLLVVMAAAAAPSPLFPVYQRLWHLTPIALTAAFGVYALALLAALLTVGSLSDHLGRRPLLAAGLLGDAAAMLAFVVADGLWSLLLARIVQGLAVGLITGTLSAALVDHQPTGRPSLAALANSAVPGIGLAAGAVGSGLLVEYAPAPTTLGYALLGTTFVLLAASVALLPETVVDRRRPTVSAFRPRVAVPVRARSAFVAAVPVLVATWAVTGLYLALGPTLAASVLHVRSHLVAGAVIATLFGSAAATTIATDGLAPALARRGGVTTLAVGIAATLWSVENPSVAGFFAGTAVAGAGFGITFVGILRSLVTLAAPAERAGLFAAVFVACYLAFSVPTVVAGALVPSLGLVTVVLGYGIGVILLAAVALLIPQRRPVPVG